MSVTVAAVLESHRAAGRFFEAAGVRSFVREDGSGEPVVMLHGLPTSSFLYRRVIAEVADRGFQALAFDLPGLGLADRPAAFDYTFTGLGRWSRAAVDALELDRFHLVVHDAGGPVGFVMASLIPERLASLTVLNTAVAMDAVPFPMEVYARFAADRRWSAVPPRAVFRRVFYAVGVEDRSLVPAAEVDAHRELLVGPDNGRAYLRIMRNIRSGRQDFRAAVDSRTTPYPVQLVWGGNDRVFPLRRHGFRAMAAAGVPAIHVLPGRHYPQEDNAPALGELIATFAADGAGAGGQF